MIGEEERRQCTYVTPDTCFPRWEPAEPTD